MMKITYALKLLYWQSLREGQEIHKAARAFLQIMLNYFIDTIYIKHKSYKLKQEMMHCQSYEEWEEFAKELDKLHRKNKWKSDPRSISYDYKNTQYLYYFLVQLRKNGLSNMMVQILRCSLQKNIYGTANPALYEQCYYGTKTIILKFHREIIKCLHYIHDDVKLSLNEKLKFFSQMSHSYGRTALLLSGGASMGVYHIGCVKVLKEQNLLPRILCGSSAGSIFAALICCRGYDELQELIDPYYIRYECFEFKERSMAMKIARFLKDGVLMDMEYLQKFLKKYIGNYTFEEAYQKNGWILNISVSSIHNKDVSRLLNYVTSPNVLIWSAVSASCAIPNVFKPVELLCKDTNGKTVPYTATKNHQFIDGSIAADLPMQKLSEIFGVNTFIVSQVNPFVIPFLNEDGGGILGQQTSFIKTIKTVIGNEIIHWINQLESIGIIPDKLKRIIGLMNQTYKGNVTISPQIRFGDYLSILKNPTPTYVKEACKYSELNTYNKISLVRAIYEIEREINDCYKSIQSMLAIDDELANKLSNDTALSNSDQKQKQIKHISLNTKSLGKGLFKSKSLAKNLNLINNENKTQESGNENSYAIVNALLQKQNIINQNIENRIQNKVSKMHSVASYESMQSLVSDYIEDDEDIRHIKHKINQTSSKWMLNNDDASSHSRTLNDEDEQSLKHKNLKEEFYG